jgi:hypothetical protein
MYEIILKQYPNLIFTLADNSLYLGLLFGAFGILGEADTNDRIHPCFKTNLKIASNLIIASSLLNLYRINRI